ncbi:HTH-type transcriptional regulator SyrM 1 [compost metagenome]
MRREAPGIDLQISHASREGMLEGVVNGDIDIAAAVFPELPNELRSLPLFEEHYACLVDRNSLPAEGVLDLPTYLSRPHVLLEMRGSGTPEIERALTSLRERRRVAISLPHWRVAPEFISGTDLILTVASRALHDIDEQTLIVVPPPFQIPSFTFVLVWHKRRGGDQALNWLNQRIVQGIER